MPPLLVLFIENVARRVLEWAEQRRWQRDGWPRRSIVEIIHDWL